MAYKTLTGIVLKRQDLREADELLTFWSWEDGKVRLLARGVKKSVSRLKQVLAPLSWLAVQIVPSDRLPTVTGAKLIKNYASAARTLSRSALIFAILELVLQSVPDREPNHAVSLLLRESLDRLVRTDQPPTGLLPAFRMRLLHAIGYQMALDRCSSCRGNIQTISGGVFWSDFSVGVICGGCADSTPQARRLDHSLYAYLRRTQTDWLQSDATAVMLKQADSLLRQAIAAVTEREQRSFRFAEEHIHELSD